MKQVLLHPSLVLPVSVMLLFLPVFSTAQNCTPLSSLKFSGNELKINKLDATGCMAQPFLSQQEMGLAQGYRGNDSMPIAGMFEMTYWIGGIQSGNQQVRVSYRHNAPTCSFLPGPLSNQGTVIAGNEQLWNRIWSVSYADLWHHRYDWESDGIVNKAITAIYSWPGKGNPHFTGYTGLLLPALTAPFYDQNGDGIYNPDHGDYPHPEHVAAGVLAGQMTWSVSNTMGTYSNEANYTPTPFEIAHTVWALPGNDNNLLNNTLFFSRDILLKGSVAYDSVFFGQWERPAVGSLSNDAIGSSPEKATTYYYKLSDTDPAYPDEVSYSGNFPALASTCLSHPLRAVSIMNHPAMGTHAPITTFPTLPIEYYYYMNGLWRDGSPQVFNGAAQQFAYSGDITAADSWTMYNYPPPYGERLAISAIYLGSMAPGERRHIDQAWSFHRKPNSNHLLNVSFLLDRVDTLSHLWANGPLSCTTDHCLPAEEQCVWPGDANNNGIVNQYDIFPIAAAYNNTGTPRESAPVLWMPQSGENWPQSSYNNLNYKYIDTNGDGAVNVFDQNIIRDHYRKKRQHASPELPILSDQPGFYFKEIGVANPDTLLPNQYLMLKLQLDTLADLQAAGGVIEFDTAHFEFNDAPFFYWSTPLYAPLYHEQGKMTFSIGEVQGHTLKPMGYIVLRLKRKSSVNTTAPDTAYIHFTDVRGIYPDGSPYPLGARSQRVILFPGNVSSSAPLADTLPLDCFPNPANETVYVHAPDIQAPAMVQMFDLHGRMILQEPVRQEATALDIAYAPSGTYVIRVSDGRRIWQQRIVVLK